MHDNLHARRSHRSQEDAITSRQTYRQQIAATTCIMNNVIRLTTARRTHDTCTLTCENKKHERQTIGTSIIGVDTRSSHTTNQNPTPKNQNKQKQKPEIKNKTKVQNPTPKHPKQNKTKNQKHKHTNTQKQHVPANQPGLSKCGASRASRDNCLGSASIGFHPSFLLFRPVVPRLKQIANLLVYMSPAPGKNDRFCY